MANCLFVVLSEGKGLEFFLCFAVLGILFSGEQN